jgi:phosphatidylglycerophosphate synthase
MIDLASTISLFALLAIVTAAYAVRVIRLGRARHPRVEQEGGGPLVGQKPMEMIYWALAPIGQACARRSITASQISWLSLLLGLLAGVLIGTGHFGLGALVSTASFLGDAVDGMVARMTGSASDQGELLDAAIDRYVEMFILGGLAVALRASAPLLVTTLAALGGAVMVSYATAKAEALGVRAPRGIMRRTERTTLITVALAISPLVDRVYGRVHHAPIVAALIAVGVLGNLSAVQRLIAVGRALKSRPERADTPGEAAREVGSTMKAETSASGIAAQGTVG